MQKFALEVGGKCLSKDYKNDETPLKWMCRKGHTWDASYTIIRQGGWCMQCVKDEIGNERLEELKQIAKKNGGKCLSEQYLNNHSKLKWKYKEGHQWEATARSIKDYQCWCPYCSGFAPRTIKDMQLKAKERGGLCLSKKYIDSQTKLWWQCSQNHKWQAKPNSIFMGRWCRFCARIEQSKRQRNDISIYKRHAIKRGGKLLSTEYLNSSEHMEWKCAKNHVWQAGGAQVLNGSWCPYCAGKAKHTIEEMQKMAIKRGGKCLSKSYTNVNTKLLWQCAENHQWKAIPGNVINNKTWCPVCAQKIIRFNLKQYSGAIKPKTSK